MSEKEKFLERILKISEPWYIEKLEELTAEKELHIYLKYPRKTRFACPRCGALCSTYDSSWRIYRDLDIHTFKTYVHIKLPKIKCCGETPTIQSPYARENSHFTFLMEENILKLAKMSSITKVSNYIKEHDTRIWRVLIYYVNKCRAKANFSSVKNLGIDETSKKGHNYITTFVNLDTRKVLYVANGKDHKTIYEFISDFKAHGGNPEAIVNVTSDMSLAFEKGIKECLVNAKIIIDKFHVVKHANDGVNKVRIEESKNNILLKKRNISGSEIMIA